MTTEFDNPNYTQTPNLLFDELMKDMSEAELKVTLAVIRKTFGWHKEADLLSISQLVALTGMSRPSVIDGVSAGVERGFIVREPAGKSFRYRLSVKNFDQSKNFTSKKSLPSSVKNFYQSGPESVKNFYPQNKDSNKENKNSTAQKRGNNSPSGENFYPLAAALAEVSRTSLEANRERIFSEAKRLAKDPTVTPERIKSDYGAGGAWYSLDWRGKQGQPPSITDVRATWGRYHVEAAAVVSHDGGFRV